MLQVAAEKPQLQVLIVDDSKLARVHLARLLDKENMTCDMAESAEDALLYLQDERPDAIFLDHNMPGMSGLAALKIIKANPATATIPVMMYTSESDQVYLGKARALGALDVLVKEELEPGQLSQRLHAIRARRRPPVQTRVLEVKVDNTQEIEEKDFFSARARLERNNARMLQQIHQEQWKGNPIEIPDEDDPPTITRVRKPIATFEEDLDKSPLEYFLVPFCVFVGGILLALGLFHTFVSPISWGRDNVTPADTAIVERGTDSINPRVLEPAPERALPVLPPETGALSSTTESVRVDLLLDALSWAMRTRMQYPHDELALSGDRLNYLQTLLNYLDAAGFEGVVRLRVFAGRFCLSATPDGQLVLPAQGMPVSSCQFALNLDNPRVQDVQSEAFARFLETSPMANGDRGIRVDVEAVPENRNPFPYPSESSIDMASEWNAVASQNNLVLIELQRQ